MKFAPKRNQIINDELEKVERHGIRELDWLANVVIVKKKNGKPRVCIDFTHLNKTFPKDSCPPTKRKIYCYKVMSFGVKNASSTYQRLVNKMFKEQIGNTIDVYIDNMLVKYIRANDHLEHLRQIFDIIQRHIMKLNPNKCTFGVVAELFIGHIVTQRGIEANLSPGGHAVASNKERGYEDQQKGYSFEVINFSIFRQNP